MAWYCRWHCHDGMHGLNSKLVNFAENQLKAKANKNIKSEEEEV